MFSRDTRSPGPVTRPAKQSSVYTSSTAGVLIRMTGAAPPNVQAYSPAAGREVITSRSLIVQPSFHVHDCLPPSRPAPRPAGLRPDESGNHPVLCGWLPQPSGQAAPAGESGYRFESETIFDVIASTLSGGISGTAASIRSSKVVVPAESRGVLIARICMDNMFLAKESP